MKFGFCCVAMCVSPARFRLNFGDVEDLRHKRSVFGQLRNSTLLAGTIVFDTNARMSLASSLIVGGECNCSSVPLPCHFVYQPRLQATIPTYPITYQSLPRTIDTYMSTTVHSQFRLTNHSLFSPVPLGFAFSS